VMTVRMRKVRESRSNNRRFASEISVLLISGEGS